MLQVDGNLRTEPKHIVFLSQLLLLFNFCHSCKADNPLVKAKAIGTEVVVTTICNNPKCPQRTMTVLFPTICLHWKKYQLMLIRKAKELKDGVVLAGDGRHDNMGHLAKFCAYTIFCCTLGKIIHFNLVQRNQAGSSPTMEFMSFKSCMEYLTGCGLTITTFISDRHASISKYMRTVMKNITHYFDLWHLKKKIRKVLSKIAKEKDFEELAEWIKPCENHLNWSATTTFSGNGLVIWAKFMSFLGHIVNVHSNHEDPFFDKCAHGNEIKDRKWLTIDMLFL